VSVEARTESLCEDVAALLVDLQPWSLQPTYIRERLTRLTLSLALLMSEQDDARAEATSEAVTP